MTFRKLFIVPSATLLALVCVHCGDEAPRAEASRTTAEMRMLACYDTLYPIGCCFAPNGSPTQPQTGTNCSGPVDPQPTFALTYEVVDNGDGTRGCLLHTDWIAELPPVGECADDGGPLIRWEDSDGLRCCHQVAAHYCDGPQPDGIYPVHQLTCQGPKIGTAIEASCDAQKDSAAVGTLFVGPDTHCGS